MIDDSLLDFIDGKWYLNGIPYSGETISNKGNRYWHNDGELHREDGPAIEYSDGSTSWYIRDQLHREDGPAATFADGRKFWFIHGEKISTWKRYYELSTLSPKQQVIIKLMYGEDLK